MNTAGLLVDHLRQRVHIGAFELGGLTVFQNLARQLAAGQIQSGELL